MSNSIKSLDTTSKIWEWYYKARLPYLASRTIDDIKKHGTRVSGNKEIDKEIGSQMIDTQLTIAQMVEYYKEDVPVMICRQSDIVEIYESISAHIHAWRERLDRGINIGDAPIDDLIMMDKFANSVYSHAKYQFTTQDVQSFFAKHMQGVQQVNAHNFFNNTTLNKLNGTHTNVNTDKDGITRINGSDEDIPERDSLTEFFKNRLITLRRF